ncbi:MAG: Cyclic nucleotide-binding domain protein, partial [Myxococcaceae bacterium]|nr:Cyclic nucleotide-binding domain protein [Myxococcaceae bacterium]
IGAARRLAELMVQYGHPERAVQLLLDTARSVPEGKQDAGLLSELAQMLELCGNPSAAEKVRVKIAALVASPPVRAPRPKAEAAKSPGPDGYGFLKALPMFAELTLGDMKALYRICTEATFAPTQNVIQIGLPGAGLFVIVDGIVDVYGGPDASSRLLNTMGAGSYVGEISLLRDEPTSARVTARTAVKALVISRNAFAEYLYNNSAAALCIFRLFTLNLAERVRALSAAR